MWFNCPCLVSDIPENVEVLEGHGETFPVGDVVALRKGLQAICASWPQRENTRSVVSLNHNWDRVADETLMIYKEMLSRAGEARDSDTRLQPTGELPSLSANSPGRISRSSHVA